MKRFTEASLGRRRAGLNRAQNDRKPTCRDILFAIVADKLDLYSTERRLEKDKCSFYCVLFNPLTSGVPSCARKYNPSEIPVRPHAPCQTWHVLIGCS